MSLNSETLLQDTQAFYDIVVTRPTQIVPEQTGLGELLALDVMAQIIASRVDTSAVVGAGLVETNRVAEVVSRTNDVFIDTRANLETGGRQGAPDIIWNRLSESSKKAKLDEYLATQGDIYGHIVQQLSEISAIQFPIEVEDYQDLHPEEIERFLENINLVFIAIAKGENPFK